MEKKKMSKKRTIYSADFKAKLVLEVLEGEQTVNAPQGYFLPTVRADSK